MPDILPARKIGKAEEPLFTAVGLGTMGLSFAYGPVESDEERFKVGIYPLVSFKHPPT